VCIRVEARWSVSVSDTGAWRSTTTPLLALLKFDMYETPLTLLAFDFCETKLLASLPFDGKDAKLLASLPVEGRKTKLLALLSSDLHESPYELFAFECHGVDRLSAITGKLSVVPVLWGGETWGGRRFRRVLDVDTTGDGSVVSDVDGTSSEAVGLNAS
jgi:hypothetical protein